MTIESWSPNEQHSADNVSAEQVNALLAIIGEKDRKALQDFMHGDIKDELAEFVNLKQKSAMQWQESLTAIDNNQALSILYFFVLAEKAFDAFHAGEKSSVIGIYKILKKRGFKLSKEELQWIKTNSDNRFLPNGPVM